MIDPDMTADEWVAFFAIVTSIFAVGVFVVMCGIAIMKVAGVF